MQQVKEQTEDRIQGDLFRRVWNQLPQTRRLLFSVPNGGKRDQITAMILNSTGLVKGVPDMCFLWGGKVYWIEFKTPTGVLSKDQEIVHKAFFDAGFKVWVFRDSNMAFNFINDIVNWQEHLPGYDCFISPFCK